MAPSDAQSGLRRRSFRGIKLDVTLEAELRAARRSGVVAGYTQERDVLTVTRRFFDSTELGISYLDIFRDAAAGDRIEFSFDLLPKIIAALGGKAHGALHPRNVCHVGGAPLLLDWVGNRARLGSGEPERGAVDYGIWLWAPAIFEGWTAGDWDLLSALRMVTLLAQGPDAWTAPSAAQEAVARCRDWIEQFLERGEGSSEADLARRAGDLLARLPAARRERAPRPDGMQQLERIEARLADLFAWRGGDRVLRPEDEARLAAEAGPAAGDAGPAGRLITVALQSLSGTRLEGARRQVKELLLAGTYASDAAPGAEAGSGAELRVVRPSACRTAERLLGRYGMSEQAAESEVTAVLAQAGLKDGRARRTTWLKSVRMAAEKDGKNGTYTIEMVRHYVRLGEEFGLPRSVVETQLDAFLAELGLRPARRGLGALLRWMGIAGLVAVAGFGVWFGMQRTRGGPLQQPAALPAAPAPASIGAAIAPSRAAPEPAKAGATAATPERSEPRRAPLAPEPHAAKSDPVSARSVRAPSQAESESLPSRSRVEPPVRPVAAIPPPPPPEIQAFDVYPRFVQQCGMTKLSWTVKGATSVSIEPGYGEVEPDSGYRLAPQILSSITYTLTARGPGGQVEQRQKVEVAGASRLTCGG